MYTEVQSPCFVCIFLGSTIFIWHRRWPYHLGTLTLWTPMTLECAYTCIHIYMSNQGAVPKSIKLEIPICALNILSKMILWHSNLYIYLQVDRLANSNLSWKIQWMQNHVCVSKVRTNHPNLHTEESTFCHVTVLVVVITAHCEKWFHAIIYLFIEKSDNQTAQNIVILCICPSASDL